MQILLVYFVFFLSYVIFLRAYRDSEHNNVHTYAADFKMISDIAEPLSEMKYPCYINKRFISRCVMKTYQMYNILRKFD